MFSLFYPKKKKEREREKTTLGSGFEDIYIFL